ncbi:hypothetical protein DFH07DRAFT_149326 [Mycena maculata]|uniref:RRM domain-containing protein n=1 Tax=Mycena maculata TaxID=230809 RepID=A0AAD7JW16_9AGAR|nr:hypothetical protein DFH07DRAFT_149326 [Mycena maculata]
MGRGVGSVTMADVDAATRIVDSGLTLLGRRLKAQYTNPLIQRLLPGRFLFVADLPSNATTADIFREFSRFGRIERVDFRSDEGSPGFATVEYRSEADAVAAYDNFADSPLYLHGRKALVDFDMNPPSNKLYFSRYPGTEGALRESLREFESSIRGITFFEHNEVPRALRDPGVVELTGSGFIEFASVQEATEVLTAGTTTPHGPLNLKYAIVRNRGSAMERPLARGVRRSFGGRGGRGDRGAGGERELWG